MILLNLSETSKRILEKQIQEMMSVRAYLIFFPSGIRHLTTGGGNSVRNHQNLKRSQITFYNLVCENKILNILNCVYTKSRNH